MVPAATVGSGQRAAVGWGRSWAKTGGDDCACSSRSSGGGPSSQALGEGGFCMSSNSRTTGGRSACPTVLRTHPYSFCTSNNSVAQTPK